MNLGSSSRTMSWTQTHHFDLESNRPVPTARDSAATAVQSTPTPSITPKPTFCGIIALKWRTPWIQFREFVERLQASVSKVGWMTSFKNAFLSKLNILYVLTPLAWAFHFLNTDGKLPHHVTFVLCFSSLIPLEFFFDRAGEQMAQFYLEKMGADLMIITLNNAVEATLAVILLVKCELRLLQSTIVGVVILHLLFVPGTAFLVGGVAKDTQLLAPHTDLNHSLLAIGVLAILLPTVTFVALNSSALSVTLANSAADAGTALTDAVREKLLRMSRGLAVILITVYLVGRFHIHWKQERHLGKRDSLGKYDRLGEHDRTPTPSKAPATPGSTNEVVTTSYILDVTDPNIRCASHKNTLTLSGSPAVMENVCINLSASVKHHEPKGEESTPQINGWVCIILLVVAVAVMAVTSEFLVESIEDIRESGEIQEEFFGLILLPFASFAAGGAIAMASGLETIAEKLPKKMLREELKSLSPPELAEARPIDLSIQFTLFWMPLLVLLGWWIDKPMHLLFDYFELALLLGSSSLVNYVTQEKETNSAKGFIMMSFYIMIATCAWNYAGQTDQAVMLNCPGSVASALASAASGQIGDSLH